MHSQQVSRTWSLALASALALAILVSQPAQAQTFTVLHNSGGAGDLAIDRAGNLYGTTPEGGPVTEACPYGCGIVYMLAHKGSGWIFTPIYSFAGDNDGENPIAGVRIGSDGSLYGTTSRGGSGYGNCQNGCGTVYSLRPPASACKTALCPWTETVLYRFQGSPDAGTPLSSVTFDNAGNIYGTTAGGGSHGRGTVYEMTPTGQGWKETILYSFTSTPPDGSGVWSGVVLDKAGNLYGTSAGGGAYGYGMVYELTPSGSGWTENVLYSFQGGSDGADPYAGLVFDTAGNLYGATTQWGDYLGGTVFELNPQNGKFAVLYGLYGNNDACYDIHLYICWGPMGRLVMDSGGHLFGANYSDGIYGKGSVFKLTLSGSGWTYTDLYDFTGGADGQWPIGGMVLDANGNLYGTAGTVWEITP